MKLDNLVIGLYSRVFCTSGEPNKQRVASSPVSYFPWELPDISLIPFLQTLLKERLLLCNIQPSLASTYMKEESQDWAWLSGSCTEVEAEGFVLIPQKVQLQGPLLVAVLV